MAFEAGSIKSNVNETYYLDNFPDQPLNRQCKAGVLKMWQRFAVGLSINELYDDSRQFHEDQKHSKLLEIYQRTIKTVILSENFVKMLPPNFTYNLMMQKSFGNPGNDLDGKYLYDTVWSDMSCEIKNVWFNVYHNKYVLKLHCNLCFISMIFFIATD